MGNKLATEYTVENQVKEPRYFLSSLDRLLINGLAFSIPAWKILNKVLIYNTCFARIYTTFSPLNINDFLRAL